MKFAIFMSTTTTMLQLMLKMQKRSSDDEFSKQEKVKVLEKSKGYMYIVFILRALLIFYTRIQYLWYTQSIYFYFIFFLSLCFIFLHYSSVKLFSSFRPVLECTNFSITWCSKQKRVFNHLLHFAYSSPDRRTYVHGVMKCTTNVVSYLFFFM